MKNTIDKEIELQIESIGFEGISIARKDGLVYIVKGGIPGEKVIAVEKRRKRRYTEASVKEIIEASEYRVEPVCRYFGVCGGCSWQNLHYEQQLYWKRQHIVDSFRHIAKMVPGEIPGTIPSPLIYNYRNKMEFSFDTSRWLTDEEISAGEEISCESFALGLHIPGRYDKVLDIEECHLVDDKAILILNDARNKALAMGLQAFNDRIHQGFLKNLVFRNVSSGMTMVILITTDFTDDADKAFVDWMFNDLRNNHSISSIVHAVNNSVNTVATGEIKRIEGEGYLTEDVYGVKFKISPFSFFQTNSEQLPRFMDSIIELAEFKYSDIVWDLFCGTGAISLLTSGCVKSVIGFEVSENSIKDAIENAKLNKIVNVEFRCADLNSKNVSKEFENIPQCDVMVIDPPRAGMHKNLIETILNIAPGRIVYVSCNPATQARDCGLLSEKYLISKIQPVDMFPHTYHIESIAQLNKKS
ncbi:MAG: 23S rRNA (uracil-5-)-methyltransferase RumA [Ignavibacteria bacterium GWB2_35_12]|nr:MAG: 23S rRNA (uracil-5-)-methyltransferase RumA [Ignavibacteria bacterium GWB2_35_12]OGU88597.1 MAG: 23S rRNA (uracil-5-)-methyltransferase RumA [Ignavibacteria bacterium RIFOXYA2_FULL_35_10]OGV22938.1 MAG: 23S rRNA (uracil-5-)-methyltransferase RumA [Ignavibacteria bacterium RIFOXYC2_FULL_35_21]